MNKKGFTLVEAIATIAILGVVMYATIIVFLNAGIKGVNVEVFSVAQFLAEGKLEEELVQPFTSIKNQEWKDFSDELSAYRYQVTVVYVNKDGLDQEVNHPTDYKKIRVSVQHKLLSKPIFLESIRTR